MSPTIVDLGHLKVDLSKLKRHRGAKDAQELEDIMSGYSQQIKTLQGDIDQMQPNMKVVN